MIIIIGETGIVTRSLKKNLETIPGKHSIDSLQKTATLVSSHTQYGKYCSVKLEALAVGIMLVQEKYQEEMPVTETSISYNNNNNTEVLISH